MNTPKAFAGGCIRGRRSLVDEYAEGVRWWMVTPKAFANSSPGLERSDNPGLTNQNKRKTLKGFHGRRTLSGFNQYFIRIPTVLAALPVIETLKNDRTPKGFTNRLTPSGFGRDSKLCPRVLAALQPWDRNIEKRSNPE